MSFYCTFYQIYGALGGASECAQVLVPVVWSKYRSTGISITALIQIPFGHDMELKNSCLLKRHCDSVILSRRASHYPLPMYIALVLIWSLLK